MSNISDIVYECDDCTFDTCLSDFEQLFGFTRIETNNDGNCLFDSILKFMYYREGKPVHHSTKASQKKELPLIKAMRYLLADHIQSYWYTQPAPTLNAYGILSDYSYSDLEQTVADVREMGKWNCPVGDLNPSRIPHAFGINLVVFNVDEIKEDSAYQIQLRPYIVSDTYPTANILRIHDGHYLFLKPDLPGIHTEPHPMLKGVTSMKPMIHGKGPVSTLTIHDLMSYPLPESKEKGAKKGSKKGTQKKKSPSSSSNNQNLLKALALSMENLSISDTKKNKSKKNKSPPKAATAAYSSSLKKPLTIPELKEILTTKKFTLPQK